MISSSLSIGVKKYKIKMITKFTQYESIRSLLVGPTKEELWNNTYKKILKGLIDYLPETSEEFFFKMKDGCEIIKEDNEYKYWGKNNITLFWVEKKNPIFLEVDYIHIWKVFNKVYELNYSEITDLIRKLIKDNKKWKSLTPAIR